MPNTKKIKSPKSQTNSNQKVYPNRLTVSEYTELAVGSCIDPELIALNFFHLEGYQPLNRLFVSDSLPRRNTGIVSHSYLKRYRHVEEGGWWCSGVDVLNKFSNDLWGQFKSLQPRRTFDGGKIIKYEAPPKFPTGIFALKLPPSLWDRIARRYGMKRYISPLALRLTDRKHPMSFWEWVIANPSIPLIITEGAKKAAALLSQGYAAIALPGINNGYRQPKDEFGKKTGLPKLIPQLEVFATPGRTIYLAFDQDTKPKTIANVNRAISVTGKLFIQAGANVRVIRWHEDEKGVDDLIAQHGAEAFDLAYNNAPDLQTWLIQSSVQLTYKPNVQLHRRYLGDVVFSNQKPKNPKRDIIEISNTAKLICLKSAKNTGKTRSLEQVVAQATSEGKPVLVLTHRIQLGEALCQRLGLPYLTQVKKFDFGSFFGYGLCIDSLHPDSGARFNADHWQDCVVIMDEAEQVIWHMLNSVTCQKNRVEILTQLKTLIQNSFSGLGQVYIVDADLCDISIDYILSLAGFHVEPYVIVNDWRPTENERWTTYNYEDTNPARLVRDLVDHIEAGGKPFISCSAQKIKSKWGTQNLESYLQQKFPDLKILRIDSESVSDPDHPAMGCMVHLNEMLPEYDIAIASPSIETGVSIECKRKIIPHSEIPLAFQFLLRAIKTNLGEIKSVSHFDSVWAIAQGVQTADSVRQALARVRSNVPRYFWAAKRGFNGCMVGNGATTKKALFASTKNGAGTNIRMLQAADADSTDFDLYMDFQPESLNTWARRGCYINLTMHSYRTSIVEGLRAEGHLVVSAPLSKHKKSSPPQAAVEAQLKQVAENNYEAKCAQIASTPTPTDSEYQKLKDKRAKTKQERLIERKGKLVERYGEKVPITRELVARDDNNWYKHLLSHYYLTVGKPYLNRRDRRQLKAMAATGKNRLWLPDLNRSLLSASLYLLESLVLGLLQPGVHYRGSDPNLQLIAEIAIANRWEIKNFLGLTIKETDSPIKIANKLLALLGIKLIDIGRFGPRGKRERVYVYEPPDDGREEIFADWLERDLALAAAEEKKSAAKDSSNLEDNLVSTIGKVLNTIPTPKLSPTSSRRKSRRSVDTNYIVDTEIDEEKPTNSSSLKPGAVVEWLKHQGEWIVQATTGVVAKIRDTFGQEFLVNCQELKLCYGITPSE